MEWRPMTCSEEYNLSYSQMENQEESCIGHMRADFGKNGKEFWHSWWPHDKELKTDEFVDEFQKVVDELRNESLKDLTAMKRYCRNNPEAKMPEGYALESWGFICKTDKHVYALRLCEQGYHVYLYAYNRELLEQSQTPIRQQEMGMM